MKRAFYTWFHNLSIRIKMISIYFFCMLVLMLTLSAFVIIVSNKAALEELERESRSSIDYGNTLIEKEKEYMSGIAEYFSVSSDVQNMLRVSNMGQYAAPTEEFLAALQRKMYILSTVVYNQNGEPIMSMSIDNSEEALPQSTVDSPFARVISGEQNYEWSFVDKDEDSYMKRDNTPKLCLWYLIKDNRTTKPIGVVAVTMDTRKLIGTDSQPEPLRDSLIILESSGRSVFCSLDNPVQLSDEAREVLAEWMEEEDGNKFGTTVKKLDGTQYLVSYGRVGATDLYTFYLVPHQIMLWNNIQITTYVLLGILLCVILMLPMFWLCSHWITKPVTKLASSMERFINGDDTIRVSIDGKDEIGRLGQMFNTMVESQQQLVEKNYKAKIREQEAELDMQQAQINPHFLYNMLHSIQWMALKKKEMEIANIAYALAHFFRVSLSRGVSVITVEQEFDLVKYYLYLQNFRFPNLIEYVIENDASIQAAKVPKFIIQPLLENSIVHGMKDNNTPLHIKIVCRPDEERKRLVISIEDDGKGIAPDVLPLLPDQLEHSANAKTGSRFALKNIGTRLKLMYHGDYIFRFYNCTDGGAGVYIETPLIFEEEERS